MIDETLLDILLNICIEDNKKVALSKILRALELPNTRQNQMKLAQLLKNRGYIKKVSNGLKHWIVNKYKY